ncbi:MAG: hypothetical protein WDO17_08130 [Alphaproteobacteria bacterium]
MDGRDQVLQGIGFKLPKMALGRVSLFERRLGGATLSALGVPDGLLGDGEVVEHGDELLISALVGLDQRKDGLGYGLRGGEGKRRIGQGRRNGQRQRCKTNSGA